MGSTKVKRIGKYEVLDVLGKGGMGVVYKASDPAIGRLVAIKMITSNFADDPDFLKRFYREAQSTGILQHPNIVIVHDLGDEDGTPFLVMEYLDGESMESIIKARRQLPLIDKLNLIIQACNGLQYAHQRNIVHRDIKPGNLMVLRDGVLKIVDFGIARLEHESQTKTGNVVGTINYMSPEQINGFHADCRTDIFSIAIVLYQLLTYSLPFEGKDTGSTLLKIINEPPPPLGNYLQAYPVELDEILQRALAKSRDERYQTAEDLAFDLGQVQDQLKRELVAEHMKVADDLMARQEYATAKEQLFQILRLDRQNPRASERLREVQRLIQSQQRSEQARQLRAAAEEAATAQQFDRALKYLDEAVSLDSQNASLAEFRAAIRDKKARLEKMREAIHRAESAHYSGELDEALHAIEEALAIDREDVEANALHAAITRELSDRKLQQQVQVLLERAQSQISSRRFTEAIEALRQAEQLAPQAPAIKQLMTLASTGREQERRRKELEQFTNEIQEALNRDDYNVACTKADAALSRFPDDRGLLKLKALAEKQRQAGEKRRFVDEQISRARKLLETGATEDALHTLEDACKRFPKEPALVSLLTAVRQNLEQERLEARKNDYLQHAKEALRRKDFTDAINILEAGRAELDAPELDDLLQFARDEEAAHNRRQKIDAAAAEAQRLIAAEEYDQAIAFLRRTLEEFSDDELEIILADAERQLDDCRRRVDEAIGTGQRLMRSGRFTEAVRYLESQTQVCAKSDRFREVLEEARKERDRMAAVAVAVQNARTALNNNDFDAATQAITSCRNSVGDHPELAQLESEIDSRRRAAANAAVSKAISDCRMLLLGRSYMSAVELLAGVAPQLPLVPDDLRSRFEALHQEAERGIMRLQLEAERIKAIAVEQGSDDETDEQVQFTVRGTSTLENPKQIRDRDFKELSRMGDETRMATDWAALDAVSQRARLIAGRHPDDREISNAAQTVVQAVMDRSRSLGRVKEPELPSSATSTMAPRQMESAVVNAYKGVAPPDTELAGTTPAESPGEVAEPERAAFQPVINDNSALASPPAPPPAPIAQANADVAQQSVLEPPAQTHEKPADESVAQRATDEHAAAPPAEAPVDRTSRTKPPVPKPGPRGGTPSPPARRDRPAPVPIDAGRTGTFWAPVVGQTTSTTTPVQGANARVADPVNEPDVARPIPPLRQQTAQSTLDQDEKAQYAPQRLVEIARQEEGRAGRFRGLWAAIALILIAAIGIIVWRTKSIAPAGPSPAATAKSTAPVTAVSITTIPVGATVRANGTSCVTPQCEVQLPPGTHKIEAVAPGYAPETKTITVADGQSVPPLAFKLSPIPTTLKVSSNFPSLRASLDNRSGSSDNGQFIADRLEPGAHVIKVTGPSGQAELKFESAPPNRPAVVGLRANDLWAFAVSSVGGKARVDCNCADNTKLALDGRVIGNVGPGGLDLGDIGEGVHDLQVGEGADLHTHSVRLTSAPSVSLFLNSQRNAGTLVVDAGVGDATVYVDGRKRGRTGNDGTFRTPLDAKTIAVMVDKSGYSPVPSQYVTIEKNREARLSFPLQPVPQKTYLAFNGGPPNASILIDGRAAGAVRPDGRFYSEVGAGSHTIELRKDGYNPKTITRTFDPGQTIALNRGDLALEETPKPAPTPPPQKRPTPPPTEQAQAPPPPQPSPEELAKRAEEQEWASVRDSNDVAQLQAFLSRHEGGTYADRARARITDLQSESDKKAVLSTLDRYKSAFESRDVSQVAEIWPGLPPTMRKTLAASFKNSLAIRVTLRPTAPPQISGDNATVVCQRTVETTFAEGTKSYQNEVTVRLRKSSGKWFIDAMM